MAGRAWTFVAVLVLALGVFAGPALGTPAPSAAPAANSWHVAATLALGTGDTAASCPDRATCWAIEGGELLSSQDGGATWTTQTSVVPADVSALNDLDCPATSVCYLTATLDTGVPEVLVLRAGAVTAQAVPATVPLPTIACATAKHCTASDGTNVYVTHDGAQTWRTTALPRIIYTVPALSCVASTSRCWVVGDSGEIPIIELSKDDGKHWQLQIAPEDTDGLYDVACPSTTTCYAVGADVDDNALVFGTHDGGATWTTESSPVQAYPMRSVSCASVTVCWASGLSPAESPYVFATTNGGEDWVRQDLPSITSGGQPYLSCPTVSTCTAVTGGLTFATVDGGGTWTDTEVPSAPNTPQALSCPTKKSCVGVSNDDFGRAVALTSGDGGSTWTRHDMPAAGYQLRDVDCPSTAVCYAIAVGLPGRPGATITHALTSTDGGITWYAKTVTRAGVLRELTCPTTTTCLAGGYDRHSAATLMVTTDSGSSWQQVAAPAGAFYLNGLSCTAVTACVLVTQGTTGPPSAWTTADLGATYQQHDLPAVDFFDLGCSGQMCVTVGADDAGNGALAASNDGGVTWTARKLPRGVQILGRVSCGSASACAATGFDFSQQGGPIIVGTTDAGQHWHAFAVPARNEEPIDVACAGASCIASDVSLAGNPLILAGRA